LYFYNIVPGTALTDNHHTRCSARNSKNQKRKDLMKKERTLSYKMAEEISMDDMQDVSAAGNTSYISCTMSGGGAKDYSVDVTWDF
tara:strand:+ start:905 stop:1162 length:258 start_codon:yes stop_codon:yes gene_type:complete